jgi:hypothetical protein
MMLQLRDCEVYSIGSFTVYDLKKQKSELLKFNADSDTPKAMSSRKTLQTSRVNDFDKVLFEGFDKEVKVYRYQAYC